MTCILALSVLTATFPGESGLASYFAAMDNSSNNNNNNNTNICKAHIVSIRDESEAEVTTGDMTCKAVKSSPPTNQHPFLPTGYPSCRPTNSIQALKENANYMFYL